MHIYAPNIEHTNTSANTSAGTGAREEERIEQKNYNVLSFDEYMDQKASIALAKASTWLCNVNAYVVASNVHL